MAAAEFLYGELLNNSPESNVLEFRAATKDGKVLMVFMLNNKYCATSMPFLVLTNRFYFSYHWFNGAQHTLSKYVMQQNSL